MSRSRYEPVSQADEIIELGDQSYNYHSAIPNSPPPSFHSSQSTRASLDLDPDHDRAFSNTTPRPTPPATGTGNDAAILTLQRKVVDLEEALGRLLLEKNSTYPAAAEASSQQQHASGRSNCCVTFSDFSALSLAERQELMRSSANCCVAFGPRRGRRDERSPEERLRNQQQWRAAMAVVAAGLLVVSFMGWIALLAFLKRGRHGCGDCVADRGAWSAAGMGGEGGAWSSGGG